MRTLTRTIFAAVALSALVLTSAACSNDDDTALGGDAASQASIDDLSARVQRNEMITATLTLAGLPLHDIDESIADGDVPSNAIPAMRTVIRMISLTNWSSDLQPDATAIHDSAEALIEALESGDSDAAKAHATAAHEGVHDFTVAAWDALAPDAGADEHGDETPAAEGTIPAADDHDDETPEAEATP